MQIKRMKKAKKESCLGSIERRTADIVRREMTTIAKKKKKEANPPAHHRQWHKPHSEVSNSVIANNPEILRRPPSVNPKRQLEQIKPTRVDCVPRRNLSRGQKGVFPRSARCISAQGQSTLSDPNIHRTKKKKKKKRPTLTCNNPQWAKNPPTLREKENG